MKRLRKPFQGLRWKLTLSYTLVTVATWLVIEILFITGVSFFLINSDLIPNALIYAIDTFIAPQVAEFLDQPIPDIQALTDWMEAAFSEGITFESPENPNLTFHLGDLDRDVLLVVLDPELDQLAKIPQSGVLEFQTITRDHSELLIAAQNGEINPDKISKISGGLLSTAVPVFNDNGEVVGIVLMVITYPPPGSLTQTLALIGVSLILFALAAGFVGTVFGYFTARGLTGRLKKFSTAAASWSRGDFSAFIQDRSADELSQLAEQLNRMAEQLQHLLKTKQDLATLEERNRLARDLHDSVKQQVFASTMQIGAARTMLDQDPDSAREHLDEAEQLSRQAQSELASLIRELHPVSLTDKGLIPAIEEYVADWARQSDIEIEVNVPEDETLPMEVEQALFRVAQEALSNITRHSEATKVKIKLHCANNEIVLSISDNGRGFDKVDAGDQGMGLQSMRERIKSLNGSLTIESEPGQGTRITARCKTSE
jgi:NarL family two-component system sensor histidine kinase LiaS